MAKKKKSAKITADHGPDEKLQHGTYVEVETITAGVKAIRNVTVDPLATYKTRGIISETQAIAGERFASDYRLAALVAVYAHVKFGTVHGGAQTDEMAERVQFARQRIRNGLKHVGFPLADIIQHVIGDGETAGSWRGVRKVKRPDQEGMVALRLALDGLAEYYGMT